jgi:hypothetical protein
MASPLKRGYHKEPWVRFPDYAQELIKSIKILFFESRLVFFLVEMSPEEFVDWPEGGLSGSDETGRGIRSAN